MSQPQSLYLNLKEFSLQACILQKIAWSSVLGCLQITCSLLHYCRQTFSNSINPHKANIEWKMLDFWALQSNISNCLVLAVHRGLSNYLLSTGESYGPSAENICKNLYGSMFHTYPQVNYSLRPRTAHCIGSW